MAAPLAAALGVACGCATEPATSQIASASTVADYVSDTGCSTAVVIGLSRQIADELACANPGALTAFDSTDSLVFTNSAVLPYLEADALTDLGAVARTLSINSAFRTVAQQYLLVQWFHQGRCGITAAAGVGTSNHETGRALDLSSADAAISAMAAQAWNHDVPGDDAHFDHATSADLRGEDTRAFQSLWNANHPEDAIGVDGLYGAETEARLAQAPATGFTQLASCATTGQPQQTLAAEVRSINGPDRARPATRATFTITIANTGTTTLASDTRIATSGVTSQLHDQSWVSASIVTTLGTDLAPGDLADVSFAVMTPNVTVETPVAQKLVLDAGGQRFGSINIAVTVTPNATTTPTSGDGSEPPTNWTPPDESGGCATTRGNGLAAVLVALLALVRRRRN